MSFCRVSGSGVPASASSANCFSIRTDIASVLSAITRHKSSSVSCELRTATPHTLHHPQAILRCQGSTLLNGISWGSSHVWVRTGMQNCRHRRPRLPPWGAIMAEHSTEPIPPDFAEAFAYAVLVFEIWTPEEPGRLIEIGSRSYSIVEVCGLVDQFTDRLPERA